MNKWNWMRKLFSWKWRIIIALFVSATIFTAASNDRVISEIQNHLGIPGNNFEIGDAVIEKPSSWLLLASQEKGSDKIKLFGILPWWPSLNKEMSPANGRYFLYRVMADNQNNEVAFFETPHETNEKLKYTIQNFSTVNKSYCGWEIRQLHNYDVLECRPKANNSELVMYIPEIQVTIRVMPYDPDLVKSLSIKRKPK